MLDDSVAQNAYAAPVAEAIDDVVPYGNPADARDGKKAGKRAIVLFSIAVVIFVVTMLALFLIQWRFLGTAGFATAAIVAMLGFASGLRSLVQTARSPDRAATGFTLAIVFAVLANGLMAGLGALVAVVATVGFSRGRQLRRFGRVLLPPVEGGSDWTQLPVAATAEAPVRAGLAAQWRENGRTEHASVAAFARLTLDLMALGAPPGLVAAANRDALDEIRHTELCFSLARALDGKDESPGAFPEAQHARTLPAGRTLALATLAVDSLVDGALHEGVSARVIAKLARRCEEPQIRAVLKEIAADEGRHAAHGWDVVEWCLAEGGDAVARALRGAVSALPRTTRTPLPEAAQDGGWERLGIHGHALEAEEFASTRADLVRRVTRMVGGRGAVARVPSNVADAAPQGS
jgi:hypothetical protein